MLNFIETINMHFVSQFRDFIQDAYQLIVNKFRPQGSQDIVSTAEISSEYSSFDNLEQEEFSGEYDPGYITNAENQPLRGMSIPQLHASYKLLCREPEASYIRDDFLLNAAQLVNAEKHQIDMAGSGNLVNIMIYAFERYADKKKLCYLIQ